MPAVSTLVCYSHDVTTCKDSTSTPAVAEHDDRHCYIRSLSTIRHDAHGGSAYALDKDRDRSQTTLHFQSYFRSLDISRNMASVVLPATVETRPGSPPELISSKTSTRSSSIISSVLDDDLNDISHFQDISLTSGSQWGEDVSLKQTLHPRPLLRITRATAQPPHSRSPTKPPDLSNGLLAVATLNRHARSLSLRQYHFKNKHQGRGTNSKPPTSITDSFGQQSHSITRKAVAANSQSSAFGSRRHTQTVPVEAPAHKRQMLVRRKTVAEAEQDYHDSDEELPEDVIMWNVPLSPRPLHSRSQSASPERDHASLRSSETSGLRPYRTKSWTAAMSDLSEDAKKLTQALEVLADRQQPLTHRIPPIEPASSSSFTLRPSLADRRAKTISLPPVQHSNVMVDPLPMSKEKENALTRTRPSWLPPKCKNEERKHLKEYQHMMNCYFQAEKRKSAQVQKSKDVHKMEATSLTRQWHEEVLPRWDTAVKSPNTETLWWQGVPAKLRGTVWFRAVGNDLHISPKTYKIALGRADAEKLPEASHHMITDISTVFTELRLFQTGQILHQRLFDLLLAYASYRPDTGYIRGTAAIAALILYYVASSEDAFITFANLLNRPTLLGFCHDDPIGKHRCFKNVMRAVKRELPRLHEHLVLELPSQWLQPMCQSLFTHLVSVEEASRLFDVLVFEGDAAISRIAVGILAKLESRLYGSREEMLQVLGWERTPSVLDFGGTEKFMRDVRSAGKEDK